MPSVNSIISDIDTRYPKAELFTHAQKVGWMNDLQKKIYKDGPVEAVYDFVASSSASYGLSTSMRIDNIKRFLVSDATSIATITSTSLWQEYSYAGPNDGLSGYRYYRPDREEYPTTAPSSQISLYPFSTSVRVARLYYDKIPATIPTSSSDGAFVPQIDEEYHDIYKYGVMEVVAKSGDYPDVEMANNFRSDFLEELRRIRFDIARRKQKAPKVKIPYKSW